MEAPPRSAPSCRRCGWKLEHDICYACAVTGDPLLVTRDKIGTCWYCEWPLLLPRIVCAFCSDKFLALCVVCDSDARYGFPFENKNDSIRSHIKHCIKHKELGEVDLKSARCKGNQGQRCYSQARFRRIDGTKTTHCKACIDPVDFHNWISTRKDKCVKCKKVRASYGNNGKTTHCTNCKDSNMILIYVVKCSDKECRTIPTYGILGSLRPTCCLKHKTEDMIDVVHYTCTYPGCNIRASFGKSGTKFFEFCDEHKPDDYIDLISKRCNECSERAYYGCNTVTHCYNHKTNDMKKLRGTTCTHTEGTKECTITAAYGFTFDRIPTHCSRHKDELMVSLVSSRCITDGCTSNASFGQLFRKATHCKEHSKVGEFSNTHPKCKLCNAKAFYSSKQEDLPQYCALHSPKGFVNIVESKCSACGMEDRIPEGETQCYMCRGYKDDNVRKKKEFTVKALLDVAGIKYSQHDRRVDEGCSRYRPDFVIDCATFMLVVECDENQHASYAPECEKGRMLQLFQDFGMPVQFIRYNPDKYTDSKGKRIVMQGSRETLLIDTVRQVMRWETSKFQVGAIYICYDGFNGVPKNIDMDYDGYMQSMGKLVIP